MANLYQHNLDLLIHLTPKDIFKIEITRVEGGGRNFYAQYDLIHGNWLAIPEKLAMEVIDMVKEGKICDVFHSFHKDDTLNF